MLQRKKLFLWLIGIAGIGVFLLAVLVPKLIDSKLVITKIQHEVSQRVRGNVTFQGIEFSYFPAPHIILRDTHLSIAGKAEGRVKSISLYPKILPLLKGNIDVARVYVDSPDFSLRLPEKKLKKLSYKEIMEKVKLKLDLFAEKVPSLFIVMNKGRLELKGKSVFTFEDMDARAGVRDGKLKINITSGSNLWKDIEMKLEIDQRDFKSKGQITIEDFRPHLLINYFFTGSSLHAADSKIDTSINFQTNGLTILHADVEGSQPSLIVVRNNNRQEIKGRSLKGTISMDDGKTSVAITQMNIKNPKLNISGGLLIDRLSPYIALNVEGKGVDVNSTRGAALSITGDISIVQDIFKYMRGGTVPRINFYTNGESFRDLGKTKNISIKGHLDNGKIFIPGPALDLEHVSGDAVISKGTLEGKNIQCSTGNVYGHEGSIRIRLKGKSAPLHIETILRMDLFELLPILKRFLKNETLKREIEYIQDLKGNAEGKLVLGERIDNINPTVFIHNMNFSSRYRYLPDLFEVRGGQFRYDEQGISIENLSGRVGSSSIVGLTAKLNFVKSSYIEIISGKSTIFMKEIYPWLMSFKTFKQELKNFKNVKGILSFTEMILRGPLLDPKQWSFNVKGKIENLSVDSTLFPRLIGLKSGSFEARPKGLFLSNIQAEILDASLKVSGEIPDYLEVINTVDLTFQGSVGQEGKDWIKKLINLPPVLDIHTPVAISKGHLLWDKGKKTSFQGDLKINNDLIVSLDVLYAPEELVIPHVSIQDRESRAVLTAHSNEKEMSFSFQGNVKQTTLDKIFLDPCCSKEWLKGDFKVTIPIDSPIQFTAQGNLEGENIVIPWEKEVPLILKRISLYALNDKLMVEASDVTWGDIRLNLKGVTGFSEEKLFVDMDVTANKIDWESVRNNFEKKMKGSSSRKTKRQKLPVNGKVKLKAEEFSYKRFTVNPLHANILLTRNEIKAEITESTLCGISIKGNLNITEQDVTLSVHMTAHDQEIKPTILCLTDKRTDITGRFDFKGQLSGQGKVDNFTRSLQGDIELIARDGNIYKSRTLDKTFDLLNETENFKGELPDLDRKALSYNSILIKGFLQQQKLEIKEGVLDTTNTEVVAQGYIDLSNEKIDLNALVAPVKLIHRMVKKIPILGYILGGNLVSVPVKVTGTLSDPDVTFFSPSAVGSELLGIIKRTFALPVKLVEPLLPEETKFE